MKHHQSARKPQNTAIRGTSAQFPSLAIFIRVRPKRVREIQNDQSWNWWMDLWPWRGTFFPEKLPKTTELYHASRRVTSIEVNGTFYSTFNPSTFRRWADDTPDDFIFALKAPRYAVNRKVLAQAGPSINRFFESGPSELKSKLGPIL